MQMFVRKTIGMANCSCLLFLHHAQVKHNRTVSPSEPLKRNPSSDDDLALGVEGKYRPVQFDSVYLSMYVKKIALMLPP